MQAFENEGSSVTREPARPLPAPGTWVYTDRTNVEPGSRFTVHASAPAAHEIRLLRLGRKAILDPAASIADDIGDSELLASVTCAPSPHPITPGSYILVGGDPIPAGPIAFGMWVRIWKIPEVGLLQVGWKALLTDIDYPNFARFGALVDHLGRIGIYAGDGGAFRHEWLHMSGPALMSRVGQWVHVAASIAVDGIALYVDGEEFARFEVEVPSLAITPASRLRIGAMAESGLASDMLDADISAPFVAGTVLGQDVARRLFEDRGRRPVSALMGGGLLCEWPLDEENGATVRDASGNGRDGSIVNHGAWMVGGPAFDAAGRDPATYAPAADPDRGHGLRLSCDDLVDAGWPVSAEFEIPADAPGGIYAVEVRLAGQAPEDAAYAPFVVTRRVPRHAGSIAVLAATNTWHCYGRRPSSELAVYGLTSSAYSYHLNGQPFFNLGMRLPIPRAHPFDFESSRSRQTRSSHLVRPERFLTAWLEREGYAFETITDLDLHQEPELLSRFSALAIVGHSEYWTDEARSGVLKYLDAGGRILCMSGDTLSCRVSFDPAGAVMEVRKIVDDVDPRWLDPSRWGECWHSHDGDPGSSFRRFGKPATQVLGMSFKGMVDDGTSNSFGAYTVSEPGHFLFNHPERIKLPDDRIIGRFSLNGLGGACGYEFDATPDKTGLGTEPMAGTTRIASAVDQRNIEWVGEDRNHAADIIHWQRPAGGEVIHFGSIAVSGALPVDAVIAGMTRNALARFGVARTQGTKNTVGGIR